MAAVGPDFKTGFIDTAPASNADLGRTMMRLLKLSPVQKGRLRGRVLGEALRGGGPVRATRWVLRSLPTPAGLTNVADLQAVGATRYLDAAGIPGRVVGLRP
jgi:hypothetical protein